MDKTNSQAKYLTYHTMPRHEVLNQMPQQEESPQHPKHLSGPEPAKENVHGVKMFFPVHTTFSSASSVLTLLDY